MADGNFISYLRVSTARQGDSGLGLQAQRQAVATFLNGGNWKLLDEYEEVESGKNDDRPKLKAAFNACRLTGATLLIARLDRLSRDAGFLMGLEKAGIEFVAADLPHANRMTIGIMAVVADEERRRISKNTKLALAVAKERGVKLGGYKGGPIVDHTLATAARKKQADEFAGRVAPMVTAMRDRGLSFEGIAASLNDQQVKTPRGAKWSAMTARRVLVRAAQPQLA